MGCFALFINSISIFVLLMNLPVGFTQSSREDTLTDSLLLKPFNQIITELDLKNTDIKDVMRIIATKYNVNIIVEHDVSKKLTLHLVNIKIADALKFIVEDNNLILEKYGSIYKISHAPDPEPEPPPPKEWKIDYTDGLLSLDLRDEDLQETIYQISKITGKTILMDRYVSGQISGYIQDLPFDDALFHLLKNNGYHLKKEGLLYHIRRIGYDTGGEQGLSRDFWVNIHNNLIDIELTDIPISQVLEEISRQMNINIFLYGDLNGNINAHASKLTLDQCLNLVLSSNDYTYKRSGDIYLVGEKNNKMLVSSRLIKLDHLKVDGIMEMLPQKSVEKADFKIIKEHNALLVNGSQDIISEVEEIISDLDRPIPQILIEALVVDFNYQDIRDISVEAGLTGSKIDSTRDTSDKWFPEIDIYWTGENANKYLTKIGNFFGVSNIGQLPDDFYLKVKALERVGKANIRSKPHIATLNGHTADLTIGQTQYFILKTQTPIRDPSQVYIQETQQFQTIEANITLKITPWVSAAGEITVEIHPEFNNPVGQFSAEVPPTIQRRALNSTVRLQDGETIVLGGLIQSIDSETISKLPILGSLPLLGRLFQNKNHNKTKNELIIYITPHLSYGEELLLEG